MEANIQEKPTYVSREEKNGITQEFLKDLFDYKDGFLYWKVDRRGIKIGDLVGSIASNRKKGRRRIVGITNLGKKGQYLGYRLIFLYHHGYLMPQIDHIDRDCLNDKIENLRGATHQENCCNKTSLKGSSSQYLGVSFCKQHSNWEVHIRSNHKSKFLGYFLNEDEAALAYNKGAVKYHKEFANLNIIKPD